MLKCLLADEWRPDRAVGPARGSEMAPDLAAGQPGCHMRSGGLDSESGGEAVGSAEVLS
jgi:hypothetical protein